MCFGHMPKISVLLKWKNVNEINPSGGRIAAENELLARLGLPPSATPEDVDQLHLAVSQFLAAAPSNLRGWAHAQAAALDEAYLHLTAPVGFEGSALMSPPRPPTVEPGGPATPPARRDPVPAIVVAALIGLVAFAPSLKRLETQHFWGFLVLLLAVIGFGVVVIAASGYIGGLVGPTLHDLEASSSP